MDVAGNPDILHSGVGCDSAVQWTRHRIMDLSEALMENRGVGCGIVWQFNRALDVAISLAKGLAMDWFPSEALKLLR